MKLFNLIVCFILILSATGFARDYAVLMQESPAGAGQIKPGIGVHTFKVNETVTLTTVPEPGWHFVYWLGDVFDPTANRTEVTVDGPKILIAVFRRDEYELPAGGSTPVSLGSSKLTRRVDSLGGGAVSGGGGGGDEPPGPTPYPTPVPEPVPEPPNDPPPVPEIPEPATVLFLGMGAWLLTINRKK